MRSRFETLGWSALNIAMSWNAMASRMSTPLVLHARVKRSASANGEVHGNLYVLRLLTPLKMSYEAAKKRAEPYNKIVSELPEMRRDTVDLVKKAMEDKRRAYVIVNNRSEGNAPLTIQALMRALQTDNTTTP